MEKEKKIPLTLAQQRSALKFVLSFTRSEALYFVISLTAGLILAALSVLAPFIIKDFMDNQLANLTATTQTIFFYALMFVAVTILRAIFFFIQWFFFQQASQRTVSHVRLAIYKKVHTLGMRYFDKTPTGWLITRITNDTNLFNFYFVFLTVITGLASLVTAFIALLSLDQKAAALILIFVPVLLGAVFLYQRLSSRAYGDMRAKLSLLNTKLNEDLSGMRIIQQFRQEKRLQDDFETINNEYLDLRARVVRLNSALQGSVVAAILSLAVITALMIFGYRAQNQIVAAGLIYAFISNLSLFFNPIGQMMNFLNVFSDGLVAGHRLQQIMRETELAPAQHEQPDAKITQGSIEFRHVSFSYDGEHDILHDVSFKVEAGETVAFVGHTGSGKSSIINLFMRFYEFNQGQILIDDRDIRDYSMKELHKKIGLVLQDAFLFVGDIRSNIRLYDESISDHQIISAARFTEASHFIERLDERYAHEVIESGASFSSGERQLLSFARTMVTEPKILVLDEATANIDTETEKRIQAGLANMRRARTTIAIAHRLSTIKKADQIFVLNAGKIVEQGNHAQLLALGGYYAEMYRIQTS